MSDVDRSPEAFELIELAEDPDPIAAYRALVEEAFPDELPADA